jgi:hypothetical protein
MIHPHQASSAVSEFRRSADRVQQWVEQQDYRGYEPFDGLSSWARPLTLGTVMGGRLLQQLIRQCPINLRPVMGVRPKESTKGQGYMAYGYLLMHRATGDQEYISKATACLKWLDKNKAGRFKQHSWSNHFDFVSRGGGYTKDDPIIVWTAMIGHAYAEAYEITKDEWFLSIARSVCDWIMALPREKTDRGDCLSYLADRQSSIHNANLLGASILARVAALTGNAAYQSAARSAMEYSCARQLSDGAWWYAEAPKYRWIDNFHTGYNLDSLILYMESSGDDSLRANLDKGIEFYKEHFFEESGRPRYYHNRTYPVDIQCAAQSIDTLSLCARYDSTCLELAQSVARWTIQHMQDRRGYFYYRQYPLITAKTPMLHWGQATMFKGLAQLCLQLQRN